ncbi:hypothetical protein GCM10019017_43460 [Streptomyces showdoensis]
MSLTGLRLGHSAPLHGAGDEGVAVAATPLPAPIDARAAAITATVLRPTEPMSTPWEPLGRAPHRREGRDGPGACGTRPMPPPWDDANDRSHTRPAWVPDEHEYAPSDESPTAP